MSYYSRSITKKDGKISVYIAKMEGEIPSIYPFSLHGELHTLATKAEYEAYVRTLRDKVSAKSDVRLRIYGPALVVDFNRHNRKRGYKGWFSIY